MTDIQINTEYCTGCGICTGVCAYGILDISQSGKALVKPGSANFCGQCGQCEAICPEGAIKVIYEGAGMVPDFSGQRIPSPEEMGRLVTSRRSIRDYKKKTIPHETFEQIFDIIRYAPTGMNGQSVNWIVIQNPEDVSALVAKVIAWARVVISTQSGETLAPILPLFIGAYDQGMDKICHSAPHLVIVHSLADNPVGFVDAMIAMTHLDLVAPTFGLGTCWAGIVQRAIDSSPEIRESVGIPEGHKSHYAMMIGYPKYTFHRVPKRNIANVTWR